MEPEKLILPPGVRYRQKYLCLWQTADGSYVGNSNGEFMCAESFKKGDKDIEVKMLQAARSFGIEEGRPVWVPGRKVTAMEADDQMERMLQGKIPDEQEETLLALEQEWINKRNGN